MVKKSNLTKPELSSSGHRLGQIIGDWWEAKVIFPLLGEVAKDLDLFLDNRIVCRPCRSDKVQWADIEGNFVDYDYVLEIGGTKAVKGIPVAFLESFWRRGARHSKDKARDDTNKLLPMRETYPTARFLAIAACGEFTEPAREYVRSREVELFFISKENIIHAFNTIKAVIDYPDSLPEGRKNILVKQLESIFDEKAQIIVANNLRKIAGQSTFNSFKQRIKSSLTATPQEIRIYSLLKSGPAVFDNITEAQDFLNLSKPTFSNEAGNSQFEYEVTFSDGSEFSRSHPTIESVRKVNTELLMLVQHMSDL
ncbi:MAG: hypothetical protein Q7T03_05135 [Deltaproteobacteria bacterium]|nr:hypothetical protein [Deltaproteobacteria bacterium]